MNIKEDQIIGELVAKDYRTASVFKRHGIDFCCQGNRTINHACSSKEIDEKVVVSELNSLMQSKTDEATDYQSWQIDLLADYIEKKHHYYVEEKTKEIKPYLEKICRVHGDFYPELFEIKELFDAASGELAMHMKKEELILFPYVRKMAKANKEKSNLDAPYFGTVQSPIQSMMHEHTTEGERFRKIQELSNDYTPPKDACNTFKVSYALLLEFEKDLHMHIHLENNILFPKSIELEKQLN